MILSGRPHDCSLQPRTNTANLRNGPKVLALAALSIALPLNVIFMCAMFYAGGHKSAHESASGQE